MKNLFFLVIFVSAIILPESCFAAEDRSFWQKRQKSVTETQTPASTTSESELDPQTIEIPEQYGTVIETHRGTNGRLIVHIQDAHCNYEAQINEANILESLINDYDLNLILKESKLTDRDFKYLRPRLPVEERKEVADELLRDGYITGVNYLDLGSDYPITIQGLEDKELYDNNISALWEIDKFKDAAGEYVIMLIAAGDAIKPKIYNDDLLEVDNKKKDYDNEKMDLLEYYEFLYDKAGEQGIPLYTFPNFQNLIKASEIEKKIDLVKVRDGSASDEEMGLYNEYLEATRDLNINSLFKEEPLLEDVVQDVLATTYDQKRLIRISKALSIMKNLLRIKVVPEEYNYFVDNGEDFDPAFWAGFLKEKSQELGLYLDIPANAYIVSENLPKIKKFYKLASDREKVFLERTGEHMNNERADLAALVAGGFHTPTLTRLLADAGYSYIVVSPKVTTETSEALYRWALKMDWIPELKGGKR
ncbi:MAG: hypothetical protein HQ566_05635 [Candidatus Omnitrophica bacterium]|nr:hypothetical protein [Candidatus Omnitrophota bacterium]